MSPLDSSSSIKSRALPELSCSSFRGRLSGRIRRLLSTYGLSMSSFYILAPGRRVPADWILGLPALGFFSCVFDVLPCAILLKLTSYCGYADLGLFLVGFFCSLFYDFDFDLDLDREYRCWSGMLSIWSCSMISFS